MQRGRTRRINKYCPPSENTLTMCDKILKRPHSKKLIFHTCKEILILCTIIATTKNTDKIEPPFLINKKRFNVIIRLDN